MWTYKYKNNPNSGKIAKSAIQIILKFGETSRLISQRIATIDKKVAKRDKYSNTGFNLSTSTVIDSNKMQWLC